MPFLCKLCETEYCFTTYICEDCRTIRHLMNLYSKDIVLGVLDKCLVIDKFKQKKEAVINELKETAPHTETKEQQEYHIKLRNRKT